MNEYLIIMHDGMTVHEYGDTPYEAIGKAVAAGYKPSIVRPVIRGKLCT